MILYYGKLVEIQLRPLIVGYPLYCGTLHIISQQSHKNLIGAFLHPLGIVSERYMGSHILKFFDLSQGMFSCGNVVLQTHLLTSGALEDGKFAQPVKQFPGQSGQP